MSEAFTLDDKKGVRIRIDRVPDLCPLCHYSIMPETKGWLLVGERLRADPMLEAVYHCPRAQCDRLFIARYWPVYEHPEGLTYRLQDLVPANPKPPDVPDPVRNISPGFVQVFTESNAAETWGLHQIAGMGYRKALELLIKDYCIHMDSSRKADIEKMPLGKCISECIDDTRIKDCAQRAVWLGNDETHYSRKWVDMDINDLKILIRLTVTWIESCELAKQYKADMPDP